MDNQLFKTFKTSGTSSFVYSRAELLALNTKAQTGMRHKILVEWKRSYRGCKAGARKADHWRRFKPSIPTVIMGNVNSLQNKIDELCALNNHRLHRECSLFIFTETWLTELTPQANVDLCGFTSVRADRDTGQRKKRRWGTHCLH